MDPEGGGPVQQEVRQAPAAAPEGPTPPSADVQAAQQQETNAASAMRGEQAAGAEAGATLQELADRGFSDAEADALLADSRDEQIADIEAAHNNGKLSDHAYNEQMAALKEPLPDDQTAAGRVQEGVAAHDNGATDNTEQAQNKGWKDRLNPRNYFGRSSPAAEGNGATPVAESATGDTPAGAEAQSSADQTGTETTNQNVQGEAPTDGSQQQDGDKDKAGFIDRTKQKISDARDARQERKAIADKILAERNSGKMSDSEYLNKMADLNAGKVPEGYQPQSTEGNATDANAPAEDASQDEMQSDASSEADEIKDLLAESRKLDTDVATGRITREEYRARKAELAERANQNTTQAETPQDSSPELSDPGVQDTNAEESPTSEDLHRELEETEGRAEDEIPDAERATQQVEINKQMLEIGAQLNAAGVDMNSELGQRITEFLINNPDQAVVITTFMKEMGNITITDNTDAVKGVTESAQAIDKQIEEAKDEATRKKLGVMKTILLLMAALLISGAGGGLNAGADLIQSNLKR